MYNSGDAAEQVVRMSLEGAEFALKITGSAAKNLAAALYTVLKDQKKTKGKARIEAMLREKRPLKVYTIKKEDCPEFANGNKMYDIIYMTFLGPDKLMHEELLYRLDISARHYYRLRTQAINIIALRLWSAPAGEVDSWLEVLSILENW